MKNLAKNFLFILLIFFAISGLFALLSQSSEKSSQISLTQTVQDINQNKIKQITVSGNNLQIVYQDNSKAESVKESDSSLSQSLTNLGVIKDSLDKIVITNKEPSGVSSWMTPILFGVLPLLLFGAFFFIIFRQAKTGAMQAFDFTKAKARLFGSEGQPKEKITFNVVNRTVEIE